ADRRRDRAPKEGLQTLRIWDLGSTTITCGSTLIGRTSSGDGASCQTRAFDWSISRSIYMAASPDQGRLALLIRFADITRDGPVDGVSADYRYRASVAPIVTPRWPTEGCDRGSGSCGTRGACSCHRDLAPCRRAPY